jgi:peptidoglycan hydrolase-like protein with peptidoglycan-binding domain
VKKVIAAIVAAVTLVGATWLIAAKFQSPDQLAARANPPLPVPVTSMVRAGFAQSPVSISLTAQAERQFKVVKPSQLSGVVTDLAASPGQELASGDVLLRMNGRPVFVIAGLFPFYRDFGGGDSGDDVVQLQDGLRASGYSTGKDKKGYFGEGTKAAVGRWYKDAGYSPVTNDAGLQEQIGELNEKIAAAPDDTQLKESKNALTVQLGPRISMDEVVVSPELPATIESLPAIGSNASDLTELANLNAGSVQLSTTAPTVSFGALVVGATGSFADDEGRDAAASVVSLTVDQAAAENTSLVMSTEGNLTVGKAYTVLIENPARETGKDLLVPSAGIVTRNDGSFVYLLNGDTFTEVQVIVKSSVGGVSSVSPVAATNLLHTGAEVRIG